MELSKKIIFLLLLYHIAPFQVARKEKKKEKGLRSSLSSPFLSKSRKKARGEKQATLILVKGAH
jgi:hypothetical protein